MIAAVSMRSAPERTLSPAFMAMVHLRLDLVLQRRLAHYTASRASPVVLAVLVVGVGCVLWGILVERRCYRLVRHRLDILPATGPGP